MTRWLQAAKRTIDAGAELAEPRPEKVLSVLSVLSEGERTDPAPLVANVATPRPSAGGASDMWRHGASVAGKPLTWTGRIVSLDAWRDLTEWERHGPNGKPWCCITRRWIEPE